MLTIFSCPKPFTRPHIAIIQRNAITSWTLLRPRPEIILFGDEEGVAEICEELGLRHIPEIARNEYGTPLVNDIFEKAQRLATYDILCYVNCDIILMSDFMRAVESVRKRKSVFLLVGQRWDLDVDKKVDFHLPDWEERLRFQVKQYGRLHPPTGTDYFVFPRGLWDNIPPFAVGRPAWDNWLIYRAVAMRVPVVDSTDAVMVVHQNHDYAHIPGGEPWWKSPEIPEVQYNLRLAEGWKFAFTIKDCTHKLNADGSIRLNWTHFRRDRGRLWIWFLDLIRSIRHLRRDRGRLWIWFLDLTRSIRHPLGLLKEQWDWFKLRLIRRGYHRKR